MTGARHGSEGSDAICGEDELARADVDRLADFLEACEAGEVPDPAAIEEAGLFIERKAAEVVREVTRRRIRRTYGQLRAKYPSASGREIARLAGRRLHISAEAVRWLCRSLEATHDASDGDQHEEPR